MPSKSSLRPPAWFRYGIVAVTTLMLCSCQAALPTAQLASVAANEPADSGMRQSPARRPQALPAIYQEDRHAPPPAARRAEYAAGIRPAPCSCQSCSPSGCSLTTCSNNCPVVGPRDEYLCDGGDAGLPAGVREDWQIDGLEQEDTVAHYDTVDGRTIVTPSNQVCIYAPRFGAVRRMIDLHEYARYDMPAGFENPLSLAKINENEKVATSLSQLEPTIHRDNKSPNALRERQQLGELDQDVRLAEFAGSLAPYADLLVIRAGSVNNEEKALLARASLAAVTWSGDQSPHVTIDNDQAQATVRGAEPGVVYHTNEPNKPRLRLIKLASRGSAQIGEEIEFTLRFDNIGNREMGNVTIVDNLTNRLEYVADSAKSSLEANFSTEPNSGGSAVLRWEIKEPLAAGQGGILQFKCRVR